MSTRCTIPSMNSLSRRRWRAVAICSLVEYRNLSKDLTSYDGHVISALLESQQEIERLTDRKFEEGTYTEILPVRIDRIYVHATPLTSVSAPLGVTIDGVAVVTGAGYWPSWSQAVTYVGGYAAEDMPIEVKRLVADLAYRIATRDLNSAVPAGVTSMTVGDVKLQGRDLGAPTAMTGSLRLRIARWRRAETGVAQWPSR